MKRNESEQSAATRFCYEQEIEHYAERLREGLSEETFDGKRAALDALGAHAVVSKKEVILELTVPADRLLDVDGSELTTGLSTTLLMGSA